MLRFHKIPYFDDQFHWQISPINGSLSKSEHLFFKKSFHNNKLESLLHLINYPYEVDWNSNRLAVSINDKKRLSLDSYNKKLFSLGNNRFLRSICFSYHQRGVFDNSYSAFSYISNYKEYDYGSDNCLQRCLLVAKTSKSFKDNGAIFIGAMFSTYEMHSWIIEKDSQPDFQDRVWINYRPLLAITF